MNKRYIFPIVILVSTMYFGVKVLLVDATSQTYIDLKKEADITVSTFKLGDRLFSVPNAYLYRRSHDHADFQDIMEDKCFRLVNGKCRGDFFKVSIKQMSFADMQHEIKKWEDDFNNSCKTVEQVISQSHTPNHPMAQSGDYCRYVFLYTPNLLARIDMKTGAFPKDTIERQVNIARKFLDTYSQLIEQIE